MGKSRWDEVRRRAYERNNDCCWACGVHRSRAPFHKWLEAHELYDINYKKGRMKLREIVALCHACHSYIHRRRLEILISKRKAQPKKLERVLFHGRSLLRGVKPWYNEDKVRIQMAKSKVKWHKWHLLSEGKKYYSKFNTKLDWERYYSRVDVRR